MVLLVFLNLLHDGYHGARACQTSYCYQLCGQKNFGELPLLLTSFVLIQALIHYCLTRLHPHTPQAVLCTLSGWTQSKRQTSPHRPRLVVSRSTCPHYPSPPPTRKQLCNRYCSNKLSHCPSSVHTECHTSESRGSISKKRGAQTGSLEMRLNGLESFRRQGCIQDSRPSGIHSCRSLAYHFVILELCQVTLERTLGRHQEVFSAPLVQRPESQPLCSAVGQLVLDNLDFWLKQI